MNEMHLLLAVKHVLRAEHALRAQQKLANRALRAGKGTTKTLQRIVSPSPEAAAAAAAAAAALYVIKSSSTQKSLPNRKILRMRKTPDRTSVP